jgi:hypothetical protein
MSAYNQNNSYMSENDVSRILHDYRNGSGSYERRNNIQYNYFVNNTSYPTSYGNTQYGGGSRQGNNGYYMSSNYL